MAAPASNPGDIFDMRKIRRLVELMQEHDLSEIDLRNSDTRVRIRRHREPALAPAFYAQAPPPPAAAAPASSPAPSAAAPPAVEENLHLVTSPMVGTFFTAPSPDAAPFVKVGDHVGPDTTICIVEAMKVFNEIPAGAAGKVVSVLVENGEPVEYGQPLFKIDTRT